ncbi:diaminopimelate decarboxylase [Candidatus Saccharibacteria bacterium]|nr:diaminopimelate decarboxylase [Candidatus Saccharibacteria bacterium]
MTLTKNVAEALAKKHGTPLYVYSQSILEEQARQILAIPAPFGLTVRYAMKANSNPDVLSVLKSQNIHIDASSGYEASMAIELGYKPSDILLTSQELAHNLPELVELGIQFNATSLRQLEAYGSANPGSNVGVRINPGIGSGHSVKTNVGGHTSSFGIWHEYIEQVHEIAEKYQLTINRLHTHIGSGTDPAVWQEVIKISLELIKNFPDALILNLGGGFKVARMPEETGADMQVIGDRLAQELASFADETGRNLHLELEPGTFLTANAGVLVTTIKDIVDTGEDGYTFLKIDTGMNDILRPSLYGAQHPIYALGGAQEKREYVVVGHNCESGDLLTPAPGDAEVLRPRSLALSAVGDLLVIGGVGAYCASMAAHGYNSYPDATEVLV